MEMATLLAKEKGIDINSNLKRQGIHSDQAVIIKEIPMDTSKKIIITALVEFGKIKSIKIQLIGIDQFKTLLFTLPVRITVHDLSTLLKGADRKTCIINCSLNSGNRICCAVIGFEFENAMKTAYCTKSIFGGVKLFWTRLNLVYCGRCEFFGHSALECGVPLAFISKSSKMAKKATSEEHFVLLNSFSNGFPSYMVSLMSFSNGLSPNVRNFLVISTSPGESALCNHLSSLECFLKLLVDQVSDILRKLSYIELVPLVSSSLVLSSVASISLVADMNSDMTLDDALIDPIPFFVVVTDVVANISLSSSKVLTTKMGGLKSKMVALEVSVESVLEKLDQLCSGLGLSINVSVKQENIVYWHKESENMVLIITETKLRSNIRPWIMNKFDGVRIFTSGLGVSFLSAGIAIIMNSFLAWHVSKLLVTILDLCASVSANTCFSQVSFINFLISRVANSSLFTVIRNNFNKNRSKKSISFKFCSDLSLVNTFNEHFLAKVPTWNNSRGVKKVLDFIFDFFDMDHKTISVVVGLGKLLDACLNSVYKQANQNWWKFKIRHADETLWLCFKEWISAELMAKSNVFKSAKYNGNLDAMWVVLKNVIVQAVDMVFSKHWYSAFNCSKNKQLLKFFKLELLVAKIVKAWISGDLLDFDHLTANMVLIGVSSIEVVKHFSMVKKRYYNFCFDKRHIIKSILDHLFCKIVLDHLVVNNELVVKSDKVKLKVDEIMKGWMRKQTVLSRMPILWSCQYMPLDHVSDNAFSGIMKEIDMDELFLYVILSLKAAEFVFNLGDSSNFLEKSMGFDDP
ncbi:hypothetical protein G9A89_006979 [Geosiphon pyriformis]|nr:hypothetical protein G9A89_006979 [Geosiphon pyriformis]